MIKGKPKVKTEVLNTKLPVYDLDGKIVEHMQLDEKIFDGRVNKVLLYEVNKMYLANSRQGTASAKTRGEVSGGGRRPWRQKGTGRARVGSSRNPLWKHGGVTFAPKPRDLSYSMPKKAIKAALVSSLNARLMEKAIKPVVEIQLKAPKTREFQTLLNKLKVEGPVLVVLDKITPEVSRSTGNIKDLKVLEGRNLNARDVLLKDWMVIEKNAFEKLAERLK
ncbi:MAG: 50S ribosomal protein L4 [Candidatus Omnitrophica bacterium]|nr:50S ribosomal protein L4 [Candidatus Omnitrophota bacterium]MDD4012866.1 50S ribosomal protein L4 [Candidatus Omnitrophota bacterium]